VEPGLSPCVPSKRHTSSFKKYSNIYFLKTSKPLPFFPPSLRLTNIQTKPASLIQPERLQEISWQDFWRSHAPWALVFFKGKIDFFPTKTPNPCISLQSMTKEFIIYGSESHERFLQISINFCVISIDLQLQLQR
jgi:hypothetical protein